MDPEKGLLGQIPLRRGVLTFLPSLVHPSVSLARNLGLPEPLNLERKQIFMRLFLIFFNVGMNFKIIIINVYMGFCFCFCFCFACRAGSAGLLHQ